MYYRRSAKPDKPQTTSIQNACTLNRLATFRTWTAWVLGCLPCRQRIDRSSHGTRANIPPPSHQPTPSHLPPSLSLPLDLQKRVPCPFLSLWN